MRSLPNVSLTHLDELSNITDETLEKRKEFIPVAEAIIEDIKSEFLEWLEHRKFAPTIKALKEKLNVFVRIRILIFRILPTSDGDRIRVKQNYKNWFI